MLNTHSVFYALFAAAETELIVQRGSGGRSFLVVAQNGKCLHEMEDKYERESIHCIATHAVVRRHVTT